MKPTQEQIDIMKQNKEAFMFWPKELQDWAYKNSSEFEFASGEERISGTFSKDMAYRLRSDFTLPLEKRWFVVVTDGINNGSIQTPDSIDHLNECIRCISTGQTIEISEMEIPYYERPDPIDGFKWVLKKPDGMCEWIQLMSDGLKGCTVVDYRNGIDFIRWCKVPVKKAGRWVPYAIFPHDTIYRCDVLHSKMSVVPYRLEELPAIVGFGGVLFEGVKEWSMHIRCYIDKDMLYIYDNGEVTFQLAVPIKARFWVIE